MIRVGILREGNRLARNYGDEVDLAIEPCQYEVLYSVAGPVINIADVVLQYYHWAMMIHGDTFNKGDLPQKTNDDHLISTINTALQKVHLHKLPIGREDRFKWGVCNPSRGVIVEAPIRFEEYRERVLRRG